MRGVPQRTMQISRRSGPARRTLTTTTILALALFSASSLLACASYLEPSLVAARVGVDSFDSRTRKSDYRRIIRTASLSLDVDSTQAAHTSIQEIVEGLAGRIEDVRSDEERHTTITCRIPSESLDAAIEAISPLGTVKHKAISARDVTEQYADLESRLANDLALRDRLRKLLDRAESVEDVLSVELELGRLQAEIDSRRGRLERMRGQVALSTLSITLEKPRTLGPLGFVGVGAWTVLSKLFFWD
jgi:hypothetical protein